jgi:hypothetical protein
MTDARDLERRAWEALGVTHYQSMFDQKWIGAWDLGGRDVTLTISKVVGATVILPGGEKNRKPVLYFNGTKSGRGLVLNKTNAKTIAAMYGPDITKWVGKQVTLFPSQTRHQGEMIDCIRIRPQVRAQAAAEIVETETPTDE